MQFLPFGIGSQRVLYIQKLHYLSKYNPQIEQRKVTVTPRVNHTRGENLLVSEGPQKGTVIRRANHVRAKTFWFRRYVELAWTPRLYKAWSWNGNYFLCVPANCPQLPFDRSWFIYLFLLLARIIQEQKSYLICTRFRESFFIS